MNTIKEKILVAMSGGVDSSVTASILVDEGYDVTGAYMINFDANDDELITDSESNIGFDCWTDDYRDATRVCAKLGIPLIKLDFTKEYKEFVLDYMFNEYKAGRTPNPDILCNKLIKFGYWLDKMKELGFDKLATGHYTSIRCEDEKFFLEKAKDENKDQTYFLHQLNQDQLSKSLFPLGRYTKDEVRQLAKDYDLPTAEKEESMGICFVGEVPMKEFLEKKIKAKPGNIITSDGTLLGQHDGLAFYTIGQRHLKIGKHTAQNTTVDTKPYYVVEKRITSNELVVGFEDDPLLFKKQIRVSDTNWIAGQAPNFPLKCKVRLRHRQALQKCVVNEKDRLLEVSFDKPQRAIAPGQYAVFYNETDCLGGGVIFI